MELEDLFNTPEWKAADIRSRIMAMMLNGDLSWEYGCLIRSMSDEDLIEEFDEEHKELN